MHSRASVALLLILSSAATTVGAFTVGQITVFGFRINGTTNHEIITYKSLSASNDPDRVEATLANGATIDFANTAIAEIVAANRRVDSAYMHDPRYHFDQEAFEAANAMLIRNRARIVDNARLAAAGSYPAGFRGVRELLGTTLHTVQDFYAHSTWNELTPADLARDSIVVTGFSSSPEQIGDTCTIDGPRVGAGLTSGYPSLAQQGSSGWVYDYESSTGTRYSKCTHGPSLLVASDQPGGQGLNKDSPIRDGFANAQLVAIKGTRQFINDVLNDLESVGDDKAICGLMGVSCRTGNQIAVGDLHTCAVTAGGGVRCWGSNDFGQLGDGTTTSRLTPVPVNGLASGVVAISAGGYHTCAVTAVGAVRCWGNNAYNQLGDGTTTNRLTPVPVSGLANGVIAISAGGLQSCALTAAGGVRCWGYNAYGQLGDGTFVNRATPVPVSGLTSGVVAISTSPSGSGVAHSCAITAGGGAQCWGINRFGSLGDGTRITRAIPAPVSGLASGVVAISTGGEHSCAVTAGGAAQCWGYNTSGQIGDGTSGNIGPGNPAHSLIPVPVSGLASGTIAISGGSSYTCALTVTGGVRCWGNNANGQLGDGTVINRATPVPVSALTSGVVAISADGITHSCALTASGGVRCWGSNSRGQLGDGTTTGRVTPVAVVGFQ